MKLRHKLALGFAVASSAMLVAERLVTIASFRQVQLFELDNGLRERALQEGNEVALVGRKALEAEFDAAQEVPDPLEQLVTYGALYRADGTLVADTPSFSHAPSLRELGFDVTRPVKEPTFFDFSFRGRLLRGVLVEVKGSPDRERLLLAASRRDLEADARQLLAVGWWVLVATIPASLAVGWWFGRRMTRGVEGLAESARHVASGSLKAPFLPPTTGEEEVEALSGALKEMVDRLNELITLERRFASNAAHELRSPLAALRGELELALRRPRSAAEYEATLREGLETTERLIELAEDLLTVARTASGPAETRVEDFELGEVVAEAVRASRVRDAGKGHSVLVSGGSLLARGSRADAVRAVRNLVDNALSHGGPPIQVRVVADEGWARVEVEDGGPGVSDAERDRIFEPFSRSAEAREHSGAGLGLGIARDVVRRQGGELWLDSPRSPTRFVVQVPRAPIDSAPRA